MNKKCFKCNTDNPLHAKYCRHCGKRFDDWPEIADFRLNAVCRVGDVVDFSWDVAYTDIVTLNGIVVTGKAHVPVTIKGDEDFILAARKGKNKTERTITVHPQKGSRPSPASSVSVLKRKKWTVLIGLLAMATLLVVLLNNNMIPSYFNISYSGWQNIKPIIILLCGAILAFSIGSIIFSKTNNIPK